MDSTPRLSGQLVLAAVTMGESGVSVSSKIRNWTSTGSARMGGRDPLRKQGMTERISQQIKMNLTWRYASGDAMERFLDGLRERRIEALRCLGCQRRYLPPRPSCGRCCLPLSLWVPARDEGVLVAFTMVNLPILDGAGVSKCLLSAFYHRSLAVVSNEEVARAFPDLTIIGCHLGQPWHDERMTLAWKHENVYVETSARTPKHWPKAFVDFARSYGRKKVIFATDYPLLPFERPLAELEAMDLPEEVFSAIIRNNALRAFRLEEGP